MIVLKLMQQAFAVHEKEITIGINWELIYLALDHLQRREDHSAIVDLVAKGGHIRTAAMPDWVKYTVDQWLSVTEVTRGRIFRRNKRLATLPLVRGAGERK
jgi:hypothetical protein